MAKVAGTNADDSWFSWTMSALHTLLGGTSPYTPVGQVKDEVTTLNEWIMSLWAWSSRK